MKPTWDALEPILRGSDVRSDRTWSVIERHTEFLFGQVRHVVRAAGDVTPRGTTESTQVAFQWVVERLHRRVGNPPPGLPVSTRADGQRSDAARWFATVVRNLARDWLKSERRRIRRETEIPEHKPPAVVDEPVLWDDDNLRKLQRLLDRPKRADVPDTHVLAYLCLYRPEVVDEAMVQRAAAYRPSSGSRSGKPGMYRPVDESWQAIQAWRVRHEVDPRTSAARAELAWVFRSTDPGPMETWRERDRNEARKAAVTVGKWAIRCADALFLPRG